MSLWDGWAESLDATTLSFMYATYNRLIEQEKYAEYLPTKGEQDVAWAVKHEFENRLAAKSSPDAIGGVWHIGEST